MSRGTGTMQRAILAALDYLRDEGKPHFWITYPTVLGAVDATVSARSSFRRAANALAKRGQIRVVLTNTDLRPAAGDASRTRQRWHQLLGRNLDATDWDHALMVEHLRERMDRSSKPGERGWRWSEWYYTNPGGVVLPEFLDWMDFMEPSDWYHPRRPIWRSAADVPSAFGFLFDGYSKRLHSTTRLGSAPSDALRKPQPLPRPEL